MNLAGVIGTLSAVAVTAYAILDSTKNPKIFLDAHGIIIVVGGTVTVALMSFNFKKLIGALRVVFRKMFGRERDNFLDTIALIVKLAETYRSNPKGMMSQLPPNAHPFLKDAIEMISNYGFSAEDLDDILTNSIKGKVKRDEEEVRVWHTVGRFPPAFGLLGATLGMIAMLESLGEPGAQDRIGPAMATALIATFYGLVLANLVVLPLSEKLGVVAASDKIMRNIIKEGVVMIADKKHPAYIEEYLKSFLSPSQRKDGAKGAQGGAARAA
jgi:chemotaxis protein MotA